MSARSLDLSGRIICMIYLPFSAFPSGSSGYDRIIPYRPLRAGARARAIPGNRIFRSDPDEPDVFKKSPREIMSLFRPDSRMARRRTNNEQ